MRAQHSAALASPALLLDTFSLFFRAFFALPPMSTTRGQATGALYGFSALVLKLLRENPGAELCFALDTGRPTFRHQAFQPYKAQRAPAPTPLVEQLRSLDPLLEAFGGVVLGSPGFEADDVLATVAARLRKEGRPALVVDAIDAFTGGAQDQLVFALDILEHPLDPLPGRQPATHVVLGGRIDIAAVGVDVGQAVVLDLCDIDRGIPRREQRRGADRRRHFRRQRVHVVAEQRALVGIGVEVEIAAGGA